MTLKEFIKTRTFKMNALAVLVISIVLFLFTLVFLRIYTNHGDSVQIPDLKGKSMSEVTSLLNQRELRFQVRDSVYSADIAPGTVFDQFPKPGMKVKENRMVLITLCAVSQEKIPMPQLTDISYRQAINLIENAGLIAGRIEYKQSEFPNLVLEQKINGQIIVKGQMVPKGSRVDLVLGSEGDGQISELPSLIGLTQADAQVKLDEIFLSIGNVTYDETITSEELKGQAIIWKQSPGPDEPLDIEKGKAIDIWLTVDPTKIQETPEAEKPENSFF